MSSLATLSDLIISTVKVNLDPILNLNYNYNFNSNSNYSSNPNSNSHYNLNPKPKPKPKPKPNFVTAQENTVFSNYSQSPSGTLTQSQTKTLVQGGLGVAIAEAKASFLKADTTFSKLFTDASIIGLNGQFTGNSDSKAKVLANFRIDANQNFSFNFAANLALKAKEIENSKVEYNKGLSKTAFLVLDTTNPNKPIVLDYFGIQGNLISSNKIADLTVGNSRNVTINFRNKISETNGDNGSDFLNGNAVGTYQRNFTHNSNITVVEINTSTVQLAGDTLIGNLGKGVIYGTIWNDNLTGTNGADKLYASLGNDKLYGKQGNDSLDAGQGNDTLDGGSGNDRLYGGLGNDILTGSSGNDVLVGGGGKDTFIFKKADTYLRKDFDVIKDFQVGIDKIVLDGWGYTNTSFKLGSIITDSKDGAVFKLDSSLNQETILISGVSASKINAQSIAFS
ncbi:calcium-binding protein [Nostoc sp.]|uniref:calcium-binding protein n=1 Tax=Nostoc sp. TaxID=1180 RepID=UPI002FFA5107